MGARLFRMVLPVTSIEKAAAFYKTVLGEADVRVSPGWHYFDCGGVILACFDPKADGDGYEAVPLSECLYFCVDDIEVTYAACREAGATFEPGDVHGDPAGEIAKRLWGERSFYVRDPFGNKLCFVDEATVFEG